MNHQVDLRAEARRLMKSERGIAAMRDLLTMLDNGGSSLDGGNKSGVVILLIEAFYGESGTAIEILRDAVGGTLQEDR